MNDDMENEYYEYDSPDMDNREDYNQINPTNNQQITILLILGILLGIAALLLIASSIH